MTAADEAQDRAGRQDREGKERRDGQLSQGEGRGAQDGPAHVDKEKLGGKDCRHDAEKGGVTAKPCRQLDSIRAAEEAVQ